MGKKDKIQLKDKMKQNKLKIYFDTSVPSNFYDIDTPEQTALTRLFWNDYLCDFNCYISEATLREIKETKLLNKRNEILKLINKFKILKITAEVEGLAGKYIDNGIVPHSYPIDALHLACATWNKTDLIATWNITHMANPQRRKLLTDFNASSGLFIPQITTPEEIIKTYARE